MEKLLADCLETVRQSPLKQRGNPHPPRPLLCLPRHRLARAPEPAPATPSAPAQRGATGRRGLGIWPRAAHPVGSASRSRQGLSIFRAEEATISRAERPPGLPFLAAPPASPSTPRAGGHGTGPCHAQPCTPGPHRARRGATGAPRTPTALRVVLSRTHGPPPHRARRSHSRPRGGKAGGPFRPGVPRAGGRGRAGGRAVSPERTRLLRAPSLCVQSKCGRRTYLGALTKARGSLPGARSGRPRRRPATRQLRAAPRRRGRRL